MYVHIYIYIYTYDLYKICKYAYAYNTYIPTHACINCLMATGERCAIVYFILHICPLTCAGLGGGRAFRL